MDWLSVLFDWLWAFPIDPQSFIDPITPIQPIDPTIGEIQPIEPIQ